MPALHDDRAPRPATVLNIQRMSTEDGPGIRTTVFFKGCMLACRWCHNPESISSAAQVAWNDHKCIGCASCVAVCPEHALTTTDAGIQRAQSCRVCATCVNECPTTAMELLGEPWELDDLVDEVVKDRAYFETSGGGVTLSGGEPVLHAGFSIAFVQRLRSLGLHVAVDTCGECAGNRLLALAKNADLVLFDLKAMDPDEHARLTGHHNRRILANLAQLTEHMASHELPAALWIRTPLIPGETDTEANLHAIGSHLATAHGDRVQRWELCTFNNLCEDKYRRLGLTWPYAGVKPQSPETLAHLGDVARASGVDPAIVHVPGAPQTHAVNP